MIGGLLRGALITLWLGVAGTVLAEPQGRIKLRHDPFTPRQVEALPAREGAPAPGRVSVPAAPEALPEDMELRGVVLSGNRAMINVSGKLLSVGDVYEGYRVVRIEERKAVFTRNGAMLELMLAPANWKQATRTKAETPPLVPEVPAIPISEKADGAPSQIPQK